MSKKTEEKEIIDVVNKEIKKSSIFKRLVGFLMFWRAVEEIKKEEK